MDRLLNVEFPGLYLRDNEVAAGGTWELDPNNITDYTPITGYNFQYWFAEMKLDLSGYTMEDLTVYFRNSFEQRACAVDMQWKVDDPSNPLKAYDAIFFESTILSTVPITPTQLANMGICAPGFIAPPSVGGRVGNFNRTHIIHGTTINWGVDTSFGADALTGNGAALGRVVDSQDYSSLEPTAAENIYCYRVFYLPAAYDRTTEKGLDFLSIPPKRVLLNCMIDEESQLEYMMRLKRSYELANQV